MGKLCTSFKQNEYLCYSDCCCLLFYKQIYNYKFVIYLILNRLGGLIFYVKLKSRMPITYGSLIYLAAQNFKIAKLT